MLMRKNRGLAESGGNETGTKKERKEEGKREIIFVRSGRQAVANCSERGSRKQASFCPVERNARFERVLSPAPLKRFSLR